MSAIGLPLTVFCAELGVVTLGTIRIIFVSRGNKYLSPVLGFLEVSLWLFAIGQIMQNLTDWTCYLAFGGGFALGNFLGICIEEKLAMGMAVVRIITKNDADELIEGLRQANYGVTSVDAEGATGPVRIILSVIKRKDLDKVATMIEGFDSKAFYSVDDLRMARAGVFPMARPDVRQIGPKRVQLQGTRDGVSVR